MLAPFWTAYLIRVIAWSPVLGQNGAINYLAGKLGFGPFDFLLYSDFAVNLTLVQLYVLFMVTPVFFQLAAIDSSAVEAAKDLGASPFKVFREVILPLSLPGIMIGFIFIFVLVMGDFATVRVIGGSTVDSVGNEVNVYYNNVDLPTAAAGASMLVVAMMVGVIILLKFAKIRDSVSVVAPAKERNTHARCDRQVAARRPCSRCSASTRCTRRGRRCSSSRSASPWSAPSWRGSTWCSAASCSACSACSSAASSCSCTARRCS